MHSPKVLGSTAGDSPTSANGARILLLVATFNERENLDELLRRVAAVPLPCDLLIIDDNSPDGTGILAEKLSRMTSTLKVLHRPRRNGLAAALIDGFVWAASQPYDWIVNLDADLSHNPAEIPPLIHATSTADIGIGSRYVNGIRVVNWTVPRLLLSVLGGSYVRLGVGK